MRTDLDRLIGRLSAQAAVIAVPLAEVLGIGAALEGLLMVLSPAAIAAIQAKSATVPMTSLDLSMLQARANANLQTFDAPQGWSFGTAVEAPLGFETWEQAVAMVNQAGEGARDTVARAAYIANPNDPCGYLRNQWRDTKAKLEAERLKGLSDETNRLGLELRDIAAAGKAFCVDGKWMGPTMGLDIRVVSQRSGGTPPSGEPGVQEFKVSRPSPLGNPYELKNIYDDVERAKVIEQYRQWLAPQVDRYIATKEATPAVQELLKIGKTASGGPVELVCWCSPRACHGDVVAEMVERILQAGG